MNIKNLILCLQNLDYFINNFITIFYSSPSSSSSSKFNSPGFK